MTSAMKDFLEQETAAGILLVVAALLALLCMNTGLQPLYAELFATPVEVRVGRLEIAKPLLLWVNDGLMAVFFFLVGLEVKREIAEGELSTLDQASLPLVAAIGGMVIPALVFVVVNWSTVDNLRGWAIPAATDIAFALGVLALLGPRVPATLKVLLLAVAIIDDIGAILVIAIFYTAEVSLTSLAFASGGAAVLLVLNWSGVKRIAPYVLVGIFLWVCVLKSGVHATLAGVVTAMAVPLRGDGGSPLKTLEHTLHPWVAFMILPLFAFANSGLSLTGLRFADLVDPLSLGIALGLVIGKQVGVFGSVLLAVRAGFCRMPEAIGWHHLYGLACLTGIGFTMSLFIGTLAFGDNRLDEVRLGVLAGSLLSGLLGAVILALAARRSRPAVETAGA